jgi:hypothetical protein
MVVLRRSIELPVPTTHAYLTLLYLFVTLLRYPLLILIKETHTKYSRYICAPPSARLLRITACAYLPNLLDEAQLKEKIISASTLKKLRSHAMPCDAVHTVCSARPSDIERGHGARDVSVYGVQLKATLTTRWPCQYAAA